MFEWLIYVPTPRDPLLFVPYVVFACFVTWASWKILKMARRDSANIRVMEREARSLMSLHGLTEKEAEAEVRQQIKDGRMTFVRRA